MSFEYALFDKLKRGIETNDLSCIVQSSSMYPLINRGDKIIIRKPPSEIKPLDVIAFRCKKSMTIKIHMVWRIPYPLSEKSVFITKGIANKFEDDEVFQEDILGILVSPHFNILSKYFAVFVSKFLWH